MTTTNTTTILELWNATGDAGIQPEHTDMGYHAGGFVSWYRYNGIDIAEEDFGFILAGHAEKWLRGMGWECVHLAYNKGENYWCKEDWNLKGVESLPDALRAEAGRNTND